MTRFTPDTVLALLRGMLDRMAPTPGERLPTERQLCRDVGCSRETLRAALARLEAEGEIWRRVGKGTFRGAAPLGHPVRETVQLQAVSALQLMEARLLIEPAIAGEAARRSTHRKTAFLSELVHKGLQVTTRAAAEAADASFHGGVAEVAANPILTGLLAHLADARRRAAWQREWDRTYRRLGVGEFTGLHGDQHAKIVDAISRGDAPAAETAMRRHLETIVAAMRGMASVK
ncbi:FadR/GntR family transcriptional regulator [Salipiger mucosus]|uniref:Transcriptional regulator, GntR family n=1 Tax=Salipiger mucosus DSM 16094 TaxID=1123237 RepID=S9QEE2_9RHOB|nr:FCD domain-containing protein [Salipiger mucosus]EPX77948.1 Transcriptional regulator, GntR family [Salipiger mucosus DSM 16094]